MALARQLQQLSPAELREVLSQTQGSTAALADLFDLAKLMLTRRELESRIRVLPAPELENLRQAKPTAALRSRLLGAEQVFPEAMELSSALTPDSLPKLEQSGSPLVAYETLLCITEILISLEQHWFEVTKSGIRAQDAKAIAQKLHWSTDQVVSRFRLALLAGLIAEHDGRWAATAKGQLWLDSDRQACWLELARAIWDLPPGIYAPGNLPQQLLEGFPLLPLGNLAFLKFASLLGLMDHENLLLELAAPEKLLQPLFEQMPAAEERLIVQGDLSIICPGPLSANLHRELDSFADSEELGLASRFRLNALSISHHLELGKSLDQIRSLLIEKSGRELPQPVEYLLQDVQRKFGNLQLVGESTTRVVSTDQILLAQLERERSLTHLNLRRSGDALETMARRELCYFSLRAESFPAVMVDEHGKVISPRLTQPATEQVSEEDGLMLRAQQLLNDEKTAGATSEILRQLQFALKNKLQVTLQVERPDGEIERIELLPLGLTESRLRGRERIREAERTLPISRIVSVVLD